VKPWPAALLERYPRPVDVCHVRPWWYVTRTEGGLWPLWRRKTTAVPRTPQNISVPFYGQISESITVEAWETIKNCTSGKSAERVLAEMAEHDHSRPLPHPGFRTGQVWANEAGEARIVQAVAGDKVVIFDEGKKTINETFYTSILTYARPIIMPIDLCYLIIDPCCPWLAPWSPQEAK
jgi:hypothetical protein